MAGLTSSSSSSPPRMHVLFAILVLSTIFALWSLLASRLETPASWRSIDPEDMTNEGDGSFMTASSSSSTQDEETNWTRSDVLLPRTYHGAYSEVDMSDPNKRYFLYSASGGFNNQRMELEYALMIGKFLNRTVFAPQIGKHTQMWWKYEALEPRHLFPMDRIIDFVVLTRFQSAVPLDEPVLEFANRIEKQIGSEQVTRIFHQSNAGWTEKHLEPFLKNKRKLLYFRGGNIYHQWWPFSRMSAVRRSVRFSPIVRNAALDLILSKFGVQPKPSNGSIIAKYNAVHVRLGDYADRTPSSSSYERRCTAQGFTANIPLFVATEPNPPRGFFNALCKPTGTFNCVFSKHLPKDRVKQFTDVFPPGQIRNDMLGIVEQLICVGADGFVGTDFSTFSYWISFMRNNKIAAFPEMMKAKGKIASIPVIG